MLNLNNFFMEFVRWFMVAAMALPLVLILLSRMLGRRDKDFELRVLGLRVYSGLKWSVGAYLAYDRDVSDWRRTLNVDLFGSLLVVPLGRSGMAYDSEVMAPLQYWGILFSDHVLHVYRFNSSWDYEFPLMWALHSTYLVHGANVLMMWEYVRNGRYNEFEEMKTLEGRKRIGFPDMLFPYIYVAEDGTRYSTVATCHVVRKVFMRRFRLRHANVLIRQQSRGLLSKVVDYVVVSFSEPMPTPTCRNGKTCGMSFELGNRTLAEAYVKEVFDFKDVNLADNGS